MCNESCWSCCCRRCCCSPDGSGSDLGGEYARQRNYLEKTIDSLKRKLAADAEAHRTDELRIMGQNVSLIRELNELRREIKVCFAQAGGDPERTSPYNVSQPELCHLRECVERVTGGASNLPVGWCGWHGLHWTKACSCAHSFC